MQSAIRYKKRSNYAIHAAQFECPVQHFLSDAEVWILADWSPSQRISFGSQARGDVVTDTDIDLTAFESTAENPALEAIRLYRAVGRVGAEIEIYSEVEFVASSIASCYNSRGLRE